MKQNAKLVKGVGTYFRLVRAPGLDLKQPRSKRYRETLDHLRALEQEFGKAAVYAEHARQKEANNAQNKTP